MAVHIIPVPDGMTPEEAWLEIQVFGQLWDRTVTDDGHGGTWAAILFAANHVLRRLMGT